MHQPSPSQSSAGGQSKPATCYNCGASDHFMMACPEQARQVPAGLAAARAAQAAQSSEVADNTQSGYASRSFKRQKTGPVVTRFPAPPTGPVVTHYAPPPHQANPYGPNTNGSYYGAQVSQPYQQQQHLMQGQVYASQVPPQQGVTFPPYAAQVASNVSHSYPQSAMPSVSQGYGQLAPNMSQGYGQPTAPPLSQLGYQNPHAVPYQGNYSAPPMPQQYGYNSTVQYGQPPMTGHPSQNYPSYQGQSQFHGPPMQQYGPYQGPPATQSYVPSAPSQDHSGMQNWGQPPAITQPYPTAAYPSGNIQQQKPYVNQFKKRPYQHPPYQPPPHLGGNSQTPVSSSASPPTPQPGYNPRANSHHSQRYRGPQQSLGTSKSQPGSVTALPQPQVSEEANEEAEFQWNLEKIFATETKKDADLISRPLPTIYDEEPILPPAYNAIAIIGKYVRPNNLEIFARDIRLSLHWPSLNADPVFNNIPLDSPLIPLDKIGSWIEQRQSRLDLAEAEQSSCQPPPSLKRSWSEEQESNRNMMCPDTSPEVRTRGQPTQGGMDKNNNLERPIRDVTPAVNRSGTPAFERGGTPSFGADDDDAWAPQPGEGQISTSPITDPTEALLASLGVTGSSKPIVPKNPNLLTSPACMDDVSQEFYGRGPLRHDSGYASQRGSISHENKNIMDRPAPYSEYRQGYNGSNPPPPPPHPPHLRRHADGSLEILSSEVQNNGAHRGSSPLTPTSGEGIAREYMANEHKIIKKPPPLRQVDDVTPRLKQRQPKVDDAYSRRW